MSGVDPWFWSGRFHVHRGRDGGMGEVGDIGCIRVGIWLRNYVLVFSNNRLVEFS